MAQSKLKRILKNWRVLIVLICIIIAFIALNPNPWREGISIKSVEKGSAADLAGVKPGGHIISVDNEKISTIQDFARLAANRSINDTVFIETDNAFYKLTVKPEVRKITLPELEEVNVTELENGTEVNRTALVNKTRLETIGVADIGISAAKRPKTRLKTGLDLQGGSRVLLEPEEKLSKEDLSLLIANMNRRLNIFGLSDVTVRDASDLSGHQYIMVEVAGVNEKEVKDLISSQGKFEAKVGNVSVFRGTDIVDVCRGAQCSGIDFRNGGCRQSEQGGVVCPFYFTITLSQEAAQRQADATRNLGVVDGYLSEKLYLYLDDELMDELNIGESLKGQPAVSVQISGSGSGATQNTATKDAINNMKKLQTILITGSLPVKLKVLRTDTVSPALGEEFLKNALITGLVAIAAVMFILLIAYRKIAIAVPIMFTSLLEVFLMLGVAAIIGWNIDLSAIAGIIASVGTGVNDQLIITDDALSGEARKLRSWKEKIKSAFSVIFGAYFTVVFAMIPLFAIGAGLLRGFAVTTIIGMTVGVIITRPAYAKIIEILMEK